MSAFLDGIKDSGQTQQNVGFLAGIRDAGPAPEPVYGNIGITAVSPNTRTSTPQMLAPGDRGTEGFLAETVGYPLRQGLRAGLTFQEFAAPGSTQAIKPEEDFGTYASYFLGREPIEPLQTTIPQGGGGIIDYIGQTGDIALGLLPLYGALSPGRALLRRTTTALRPLEVRGTSVIERITPTIRRVEETPVVEQVATKPTKAALDINRAIAESGFRQLPEPELARFTPITKEQTINDVTNLLNTNNELAKDIARGLSKAPDGINEQVLFNAVKNQARRELDMDLLRDLAKSPIATRRSQAAQTLGSAGFNNDPFDPVDAISSVIKERQKTFQLKNKVSYDRARVNAVREAKEALAKVKTPKTWDEFVDSITC